MNVDEGGLRRPVTGSGSLNDAWRESVLGQSSSTPSPHGLACNILCEDIGEKVNKIYSPFESWFQNYLSPRLATSIGVRSWWILTMLLE